MSDATDENTPLHDALTRFEAAYQQFLAEADSYPDAKHTASGACGEWSPREILAHMAGWLHEAQRRFRRYGKGTGDIRYNTDAFNEVSLWQRRNDDYSKILAELKTESAKVADTIRGLSERQKDDDRYREWLDALGNDARNHLNDLQTFREQA
jgi:hypothetical protein